MAESSSWLTTEFIKTMRALGAEEIEPLRAEANRLLALWNEPRRAFHNQNHLVDMLTVLDTLMSNIHEPAVLQAAAWYHGVSLYQDGSSRKAIMIENYPSSADQALSRLPEIGVTREAATRVAELILSLSELNASDDDMDGQVFIDAALSYLGASPQDYRDFGKLIRLEMPALDDRTYARLRRSYISALLDRDSIYRSPQGRAFENNARQNLAGELAQLNKLLPPSEKHTSSTDQIRVLKPLPHHDQPTDAEDLPPLVAAQTDAQVLETTQTLKIKSAVKRPVVRKSILGDAGSASGPSTPPNGTSVLSMAAAAAAAHTSTIAAVNVAQGGEQNNNSVDANDSDASSLESVADIIESMTMSATSASASNPVIPATSTSPANPTNKSGQPLAPATGE